MGPESIVPLGCLEKWIPGPRLPSKIDAARQFCLDGASRNDEGGGSAPTLTHRMTNGFAGTSVAVEIHTLLVSRYSRTASMPLSRPTPEYFMPPNGIM